MNVLLMNGMFVLFPLYEMSTLLVALPAWSLLIGIILARCACGLCCPIAELYVGCMKAMAYINATVPCTVRFAKNPPSRALQICSVRFSNDST